MSIVILKLPEVKEEAERPTRFPVCKGETFQRWGGQFKKLRDPQVKRVVVYRYRCCSCRHLFRHYSEGVDQAQQSQRLRKLAALTWMLGLSYRGLSAVFDVFGVNLSRMTGWRDVQVWAEQLRKQRKWQKVRVLGIDGAYVLGWGKKQKVLIAVDLGTGQPVHIGYVDEHDPQTVRRWLEPLVKQLGVSVIVTDDLVTYRVVTEKLALEHQVCKFHVRRWVGKTLKELRESVPEEYLWMIDEIKQILDDLAPEVRSRTVRGYKSQSGMLNALMVTGSGVC